MPDNYMLLTYSKPRNIFFLGAYCKQPEREVNRIKKGKKRKTKIDKKQILDELNVKNGESRRFIDYLQHAKRVYPDEKYIVNFKRKTIDKIFVRFQK